MAYRVPFVDPRAHYRCLKAEIDAAFTETLARGDLVLRQQLDDFERHFATFVGTKYAIGVNSGYHALHFSLIAAGVGPGDEVITVGHTFAATVSAIVHCGATPVLIEVASDYNMDTEALRRAVTVRSRAVIPVHLNGRVCEMDRILEIATNHRLVVIEDAAQALGATFDGKMAGTFGLSGCFSFYPFKALGGLGDGGAVTTNDPELARTIRLLRFNGEDRETGEFHFHGYTALLDNVNAAVLDVKLRHLPAWIAHRRRIAELYREALTGVGDLRLPHFSGAGHVDSFQSYVVRSRHRNELREFLRSEGVETLVHWPKPLWEHKGLGLVDPKLVETDRLCREVLSLPMSGETTPADVDVVAATVRQFFSRAVNLKASH
jgi:dTDP-3-amino-2,3,6-trideoxy-4-keto-D-glucose/dTDP-3-amino-3,4,6-trideoxy-alpha-D-glucose/dTDP-2,6-dideoxy-D-kanosamine transaminase